MRVIAHISDVHFGKFDSKCIKPLHEALESINPHLVVISGDLTQRARKNEYEAARDFLRGFKHPTMPIPGNHDIRPLYSPISRILDAYDRYREYISEDIEPVYSDDEVAIAAINTVRSSSIKDGRVSRSQIERVKEWFRDHHPNKIKIVVSHHPFDMPASHTTSEKEYVYPKKRLARNSQKVVESLARVDTDIFLSGHYHQSSVGETAVRYNIKNYSGISIRAGTLSIRQRGEAQSFNIISVDDVLIKIDTYLFMPNGSECAFQLVSSTTFARRNKNAKPKWPGFSARRTLAN